MRIGGEHWRGADLKEGEPVHPQRPEEKGGSGDGLCGAMSHRWGDEKGQEVSLFLS